MKRIAAMVILACLIGQPCYAARDIEAVAEDAGALPPDENLEAVAEDIARRHVENRRWCGLPAQRPSKGDPVIRYVRTPDGKCVPRMIAAEE